MNFLFGLACVTLWLLAFAGLLRRTGWRPGAALALGIPLAFVSISLLYQTLFLCGLPRLTPFADAAAAVVCAFSCWRHRGVFTDLIRSAGAIVRACPLSAAFGGLAVLYLTAQALLLPPGNHDSMTYNLARVLLFQQEHTLFLRDVSTPRQSFFPLGADLLTHGFLRANSDLGIGLFSLLSYVAIGCGVHAIARTFASQRAAFTAALIVLGTQELVFQATSTKNDIVMAAVAVACVLLLTRLAEQPRASDPGLLVVLGAFGVSVKTTWLLFAAPLLAVYAPALLRAGLGPFLLRSARAHPMRWAGLSLAALLLAEPWLFAFNRAQWGGWLGPADFSAMNRNADGVAGALANMIRYLLQAVDPLPLGNSVIEQQCGASLTAWLMKLHDAWMPAGLLKAGTGRADWAFRLCCRSAEDYSWHGPLGLLLALPAAVWCALTIRTRPVAGRVAWTLAGYVAALALLMKWTPWNGRYLSVAFALSGVCVAASLERFPRVRGLLPTLRAVALLLLGYACVFNEMKPLYTVPGATITTADVRPSTWKEGIATRGVWSGSRFGRDRLYYARLFFGDNRVERFREIVPPGSQVALVTDLDTAVYPFLQHNRSIRFVPVTNTIAGADLTPFAYVLGLDRRPTREQSNTCTVIWTNGPDTRRGFLLRVPHERSASPR